MKGISVSGISYCRSMPQCIRQIDQHPKENISEELEATGHKVAWKTATALSEVGMQHQSIGRSVVSKAISEWPVQTSLCRVLDPLILN